MLFGQRLLLVILLIGLLYAPSAEAWRAFSFLKTGASKIWKFGGKALKAGSATMQTLGEVAFTVQGVVSITEAAKSIYKSFRERKEGSQESYSDQLQRLILEKKLNEEDLDKHQSSSEST